MICFSWLYSCRAVAHNHIGDNGGGHCLEDDGDSRAEARVVPSGNKALGGFAVFAGAFLRLGDGWSRLDRDAEDDGFTVGYTAQNTSGIIGEISVFELVVILASA